MSLFAIGDIHGCYDKLKKLFEIIPLKKNDEIIFLGDYIDRGPDSKKVIDFILELKSIRGDKVICLKGNHEKMFLDFLKGENIDVFFANGGQETIKSYSVSGHFHLPSEHLDFFNSLKLYYETKDYLFVHAGIAPNKALSAQDEEDLLWIRSEFIYSDIKIGKKVIFGHTPSRNYLPYFDKDKIGIDTGAVYGGFLTAIKLPEEEIFQI
ncbi:MAG: serine/threonine protein phosphatase [Proteobacteria bacterium]|nr:serine/threonine protein phosphatase [Pseudomonadota bacterium]